MVYRELTVERLKKFLKNKGDDDIILIYNKELRQYEPIFECEISIKHVSKLEMRVHNSKRE